MSTGKKWKERVPHLNPRLNRHLCGGFIFTCWVCTMQVLPCHLQCPFCLLSATSSSYRSPLTTNIPMNSIGSSTYSSSSNPKTLILVDRCSAVRHSMVQKVSNFQLPARVTSFATCCSSVGISSNHQ